MRKRAYGLWGHKRLGQGWAHRLSNSVYSHVWYPQLVVNNGYLLLLRRDESGPVATYTWCLYSFNKNWSPFHEVVSSMLGVSSNFFCKGSDYKYFRLCGPCCLCHDFTLAILACEGSLRQSVNKWVCLGSNQILCMDTEMWLLSLAAPGRYCLRHPGSVFLEEHGVFNAACGIFNCSLHTLSCGVWDLVPWPRIEPMPPALGAWTQPLDHQGNPWISFNYQLSSEFFRIIFQAF